MARGNLPIVKRYYSSFIKRDVARTLNPWEILMIIRFCIVATTLIVAAEVHAQQPDDLNKLRFTAVYITKGARPFAQSASIGEFTVNGPNRETLRPLPSRTVRAAVDGKMQQYFTLTHHDAFRMDSNVTNPTQLKPALAEEQRISWPCGLTFDTKRNRLLVISRGGKGYLYSYSPTQNKWSVLADANNIDFAAIGYSEGDDLTYGLYQGYRDQSGPTLCQFNSLGAIIKSISLKNPQLAESIGRSPVSSIVQLIPLKNHIVVIVTPEHRSEDTRNTKTHLYVINKSNYEVRRTWSE